MDSLENNLGINTLIFFLHIPCDVLGHYDTLGKELRLFLSGRQIFGCSLELESSKADWCSGYDTIWKTLGWEEQVWGLGI